MRTITLQGIAAIIAGGAIAVLGLSRASLVPGSNVALALVVAGIVLAAFGGFVIGCAGESKPAG
jgi:Na+/citrate or Na+/malate symporter